MLMPIVVIGGIFVLLKYLPLWKVKLIEGVFEHHEYSHYFFDSYCRECFEKNITDGSLHKCQSHWTDIYGNCAVTLPPKAERAGSYEPQKGDSVEIVAWKNGFGQVLIYHLFKTDFAEKFGQSQIAAEEKEQAVYDLAKELREAVMAGLSVAEYRKNKEAERIQKASKGLNISVEEVIAGKYHLLPDGDLSAEISARRLTKERGVVVTREQVLDEDWKAMQQTVKRVNTARAENNPENAQYFMRKHLMDNLRGDSVTEYAVTGTLKNTLVLTHVKQCDICLPRMDEARQDYLKPPGPECYSTDELRCVKKTGMLAENREKHKRSCFPCNTRFWQFMKEHMVSPSGPECLTDYDLHTYVISHGQVPPERAAHVENCLRCKNNFESRREIYLDRIAPEPEMPTPRLTSWRGRYNKQKTVSQ